MFSNKNITYSTEYDCDSFFIHITIGEKQFKNSMMCTLYREIDTIKIDDIFVCKDIDNCYNYKKHINKGYGTRMMNMLLEFAKANNYRKIIGNLSPHDNSDRYDNSHRERQIHFYKKFGFNILPDEDTPCGIELLL